VGNSACLCVSMSFCMYSCLEALTDIRLKGEVDSLLYICVCDVLVEYKCIEYGLRR
jgi:hypothetical protein